MSNTPSPLWTTLVAVAVILYNVLLPGIAIWALNTLFLTQIPYTVQTYFATLFLYGILHSRTPVTATPEESSEVQTGETR